MFYVHMWCVCGVMCGMCVLCLCMHVCWYVVYYMHVCDIFMCVVCSVAICVCMCCVVCICGMCVVGLWCVWGTCACVVSMHTSVMYCVHIHTYIVRV